MDALHALERLKSRSAKFARYREVRHELEDYTRQLESARSGRDTATTDGERENHEKQIERLERVVNGMEIQVPKLAAELPAAWIEE